MAIMWMFQIFRYIFVTVPKLWTQVWYWVSKEGLWTNFNIITIQTSNNICVSLPFCCSITNCLTPPLPTTSTPTPKKVQSFILGHLYLWPHSMGLKAPYQGTQRAPQPSAGDRKKGAECPEFLIYIYFLEKFIKKNIPYSFSYHPASRNGHFDNLVHANFLSEQVIMWDNITEIMVGNFDHLTSWIYIIQLVYNIWKYYLSLK